MDDASIKLYITTSHPCSYLEGETARSLLVDPKVDVNRRLAGLFAEKGFRRSGKHYYQPHCEGCQACQPVRICVDKFHFKRRFRRLLKANEDLEYRALEDIDSDECYQLFEKYIVTRHKDGDMYPPSRDSYRDFLARQCQEQFYVGLYDKSRLVSVMVIDHFNTAMSAVYTFFDPDESRRSLGTYAVLWQILRCRELGYPYLYLGFLIENCRKMAYKKDFTPAQVFKDGKWQQCS